MLLDVNRLSDIAEGDVVYVYAFVCDTDDTIIKIESRANHIIAKNKNKAVSRLIFYVVT